MTIRDPQVANRVPNIANGSITEAKLADYSVTEAKLAPQTIRSITGASDTPTLDDRSDLIIIATTSGAVTITINAFLSLSAGQRIDFLWTGAASSVTFVASSVTLNATPGLKLRARYSAASLICTAWNTYVLVGDLSA